MLKSLIFNRYKEEKEKVLRSLRVEELPPQKSRINKNGSVDIEEGTKNNVSWNFRRSKSGEVRERVQGSRPVVEADDLVSTSFRGAVRTEN